MGYTHYFGGLQPDEELAYAAEELAAAADVSVKGWDGLCEPRFLPEVIDFNGDAELGEDFETFRLAAGDYDFNFCKTGRRPYDKVVGALLMRAIVLEAEGCDGISSDGNYDDWAASGSFELYEEVFGLPSDEDWEKIGAVLGWA